MMNKEPSNTGFDTQAVNRNRVNRPATKRAQSVSPAAPRMKSMPKKKSFVSERRCQSLSPSKITTKSSMEHVKYTKGSASTPATVNPPSYQEYGIAYSQDQDRVSEKDLKLPQTVVAKIMRGIATKKREFYKIRKTLISLQNSMLEQYAALRDLESRAGIPPEESLDNVCILNVKGWPAHDLLLLTRSKLIMPTCDPEIMNLGNQIIDQLQSNLAPIPESILNIAAEVMASRIELLSMVKGKNRVSYTNMEWKTKNMDFEQETERLHRMIAETAESIKEKINNSIGLLKVPWLDRDTLIKKIERYQRENMILQHKLDEVTKNENNENKLLGPQENVHNQTLSEELSKERAAREALKEVVSAAESMLRVARARIATLERQLKDTRAELEAARRKHKDLEQLYRHRETSFDARSKKLIEVSKTGEVTIEALSRQRDALELRVKELREITEQSDYKAEIREAELRSRADSMQARAQEQEKQRSAAEARVKELEIRLKDLEENLRVLREKSVNLVDIERKRCVDYLPSKVKEPSDRETEIWKELQLTRIALSRAEEELRLSRDDKDSFLESLSRIAQGERSDNMGNKMATELLNREHKIVQLQRIIEELKENEKIMEQSMTQYENQLAALRLEVKRLRNYDCYVKEVPYQQLQTELLELQVQVETLSRERTALITAAASRALMLERNERSAELFARITKARRELAAHLAGTSEPPSVEGNLAQVSRSLTSLCVNGTEKWSALRAERARVLRLESAVVAQTLQLEREGRVRTQLERRRSLLEREVLRTHVHSYTASESTKFSISS